MEDKQDHVAVSYSRYINWIKNLWVREAWGKNFHFSNEKLERLGGLLET